MDTRVVAVKLTESLLARTDRFAISKHLSRSEVIRSAVQYALEKRDVLRLFEKLAPRGVGFKTVTVKMPPELVDVYTQLSQSYGVSRSELIRRALEAYLPLDDIPKARVEKIRL